MTKIWMPGHQERSKVSHDLCGMGSDITDNGPMAVLEGDVMACSCRWLHWCHSWRNRKEQSREQADGRGQWPGWGRGVAPGCVQVSPSTGPKRPTSQSDAFLTFTRSVEYPNITSLDKSPPYLITMVPACLVSLLSTKESLHLIIPQFIICVNSAATQLNCSFSCKGLESVKIISNCHLPICVFKTVLSPLSVLSVQKLREAWTKTFHLAFLDSYACHNIKTSSASGA